MSPSNFAQDLSPQQLTVIAALSTGLTVTNAAELAGVHRSTIYNWRRGIDEFRAALRHSRAQIAQLADDGIQSMVSLALDTIQQLLESEKTPASIKLKAAQAILNSARNFNQPANVSPTEKFEQELRSSAENCALDEFLALAEPTPEPAVQPLAEPTPLLDAVRHNSTLLPPSPGRRTIFPLPPPLPRRFGVARRPADPDEEAA